MSVDAGFMKFFVRFFRVAHQHNIDHRHDTFLNTSRKCRHNLPKGVDTMRLHFFERIRPKAGKEQDPYLPEVGA
ncbi:hypothetical protein [Komagataeibacter sp. FNDCR2]|uniref:hypothetical protein n=1 Tax=Komagataeibacter sp. FNDCR2 TaxID=2878682 RepID=UPI001E444D0B|nr:hypothetical protein [Komagataeibacter sp. FNDCR2]MCE2574789.1 hypothetical protein [Komagataeibacter sp. FNDCR2]